MKAALVLAMLLQSSGSGEWRTTAEIDLPDPIYDTTLPYLQCLMNGWNSRVPVEGTSDRTLLANARDEAIAECRPIRHQAFAASDSVMKKQGDLDEAARHTFVEDVLIRIDHVFDGVLADDPAPKD